MVSRSFDIFELAVGGGTLALCPLPVGHMETVQAWSPDLVISMVEAHEMPSDLRDACNLCHVPVKDYGVPEGDVWDGVEGHVLQTLAGNGRVLVHCKGGCGRSGMAVLRIMLAAGEADALTRLRAVRPCAIETDAQMAWALKKPDQED